MPNKQLVDYIEKHHKKGIHSDRIKSVLLEAGHKPEHVDEALSHVHFKNNLAKIMIAVAAVVLLVALVLIEATKPSKVVEEVIEPETEALSPAETVPSAATTIPEQKSEYGFDTDAYDMLITEAIQLKRIDFCDQIEREYIKEKCKEMVEKG